MTPNSFTIKLKEILTASLISSNSQNWMDYNGNLVPWSGSVYIGPNVNDVYFNTYTSSLSMGYFKWNGTTWNQIEKEDAMDSYNIPILITSDTDEMGVMVGFDGYIEPVDLVCNFSYTQTGNTIQIYNTVNSNKLRILMDFPFLVEWGDGTTDEIITSTGENLTTVTHEYSSNGDYKIKMSSQAQWILNVTEKKVTIPSNIEILNPLGEFIYTGNTIPYYNLPFENYLESGRTIESINVEDTTIITGNTSFYYMSIGQSRIEEKKLYGENSYSGVTSGSLDDGTLFWDYTIDGLHYRDLIDGYTIISGNTSGYTKEEVFNQVITRNEHFLGFVDEPIIYSDIFIERGKEGVMEKNLRLSEIDNIGEIDIYGNGYFKVRKS